jgi:hypothetical protein
MVMMLLMMMTMLTMLRMPLMLLHTVLHCVTDRSFDVVCLENGPAWACPARLACYLAWPRCALRAARCRSADPDPGPLGPPDEVRLVLPPGVRTEPRVAGMAGATVVGTQLHSKTAVCV